jgi:hypothetical protein
MFQPSKWEEKMLIEMKIACLNLYDCSLSVGPSVNTLRAQLIFPYKHHFCNFFEFPATKSTQKSISSTPWL